MSSRPQRGRFRQQAEFIVWASNGDLPLDRGVPCLPGVFRASNVQGQERIHQTQKPLEIMRQIIKITTPGGRILDPFAGSGSTLAAAQLEGFDAVGIEVHAAIAAAAGRRLGIDVNVLNDDNNGAN
ncbi:MAG: site-specific DNA-methyltransferase, partial [Clostridia bacterium]|nr:site-specific DNA-methyltransferase [Clostridia bacterium]